MKRYFISGGSSGVPKDVCHDSLEWQYIILDTASVLRAFGVRSGSTVLIALPSFPWSIGGVFADASEMCGAEVICYGLEAGEGAFVSRWSGMNVSHIIAGPSLLLRWATNNVNSVNGASLIVVGEPLNKAKEIKLRELWRPSDIRRIYGLSELGTLGYQFAPEDSSLCMNPRFNYCLTGNDNPSLGDVGNLVIASKYGGEIITTKDTVRVWDKNQGAPIWDKTFVIEFLNRSDSVLTLSDGTTIHESIVTSLASKFGLSTVQCCYKIEKGTESLIFKYVGLDSNVCAENLYTELLMLIPELCDEFARKT